MRVAVADDSYIFRQGLLEILASVGAEVVVEAASGQEALAWMARAEPVDVAVLDLRMPPTHTDEGLTTAVEITRRWPGTGVLLLSSYAETHHAAQLLDLDVGGVGYLLKDRVDDASVLHAALERLAAGGVVIEPELVRGLVRHRRRGVLDRLTPRELEVLELMAQGSSNLGIAEALGIRPRTAENHVSAVFDAFGLPNAPEENRRVRAVVTYLRETPGGFP